VNESREALAHQRLAARLLALRTQQLENKLSQVSDDYVTHSNVGCLDESNQVENKFSPVSEDHVTANDVASLQESNIVGDKLSPVSDNFVTPADEVDTVDRNAQKFSYIQFGVSTDTASGMVSSQLARSNDAVDSAVAYDESTLYRKTLIPESDP